MIVPKSTDIYSCTLAQGPFNRILSLAKKYLDHRSYTGVSVEFSLFSLSQFIFKYYKLKSDGEKNAGYLVAHVPMSRGIQIGKEREKDQD